jgi:hypothetical protein
LERYTQEPPLRQSGHVVDITGQIHHQRVVGPTISEYRSAA